jgi:hypothetical protein
MVQILAFLDMFLLFSSTYLFQFGMVGLLLSHFKWVLYAYPAYFLLTVITGMQRTVRVSTIAALCVFNIPRRIASHPFPCPSVLQSALTVENYTFETIWEMDSFRVLSCVHKIGTHTRRHKTPTQVSAPSPPRHLSLHHTVLGTVRPHIVLDIMLSAQRPTASRKSRKLTAAPHVACCCPPVPPPPAAACIFYVANLRAVMTLGQPKFYSKDAWVALFRQSGGGPTNAN